MIRLGLVGHPLDHSLSPGIQAAFLRECGLEGTYTLFPVPPDGRRELEVLLDRVREGGLTGLNVTIPHKQRVIPLLDELDPQAEAIGAVNTIVHREGRLAGVNTDAGGFLADLHRLLPAEPSVTAEYRDALVLGAGGSARAVVHALHADGWRVTLAARRIGRARGLADRYEGMTAVDLEGASSISRDFRLIVNATPVGMIPDVDGTPLPGIWPGSGIVYDLVYNPPVTRLMREARVRGWHVATGFGMLVGQAASSFEAWTGCRPSPQVCSGLIAGAGLRD